MTKEQVLVVLSDDALKQFADIVEQMQTVGLEVEQQLETSGVITGMIDPVNISDLKQVRGVAAVEPGQTFHIPPPDSDIQ